MIREIAKEYGDAASLLPPDQPDGSGIGVHYVDAYIKPFNVELDGGQKIACKRKGLKIIFTISNPAGDDRSGEALLRRIDDGPDPRKMLRKTLEAAAVQAGSSFEVDEGTVFLDI